MCSVGRHEVVSGDLRAWGQGIIRLSVSQQWVNLAQTLATSFGVRKLAGREV